MIKIFYGRDTDKRQLTDLVLLEKMVLLYAKSGLGKSSLVNAGVIPLLAEESNFQSITVRFYAYNPEGFTPPLLTLQRAIQQKTQTLSMVEDLDNRLGMMQRLSRSLPTIDNVEDASLWYLFKARQVAGGKPLALFFDQFEELFTYPAELYALNSMTKPTLFDGFCHRIQGKGQQEFWLFNLILYFITY